MNLTLCVQIISRPYSLKMTFAKEKFITAAKLIVAKKKVYIIVFVGFFAKLWAEWARKTGEIYFNYSIEQSGHQTDIKKGLQQTVCCNIR